MRDNVLRIVSVAAIAGMFHTYGVALELLITENADEFHGHGYIAAMAACGLIAFMGLVAL